MTLTRRELLHGVAASAIAASAHAQPVDGNLPTAARDAINAIVADYLRDHGVPGVSMAVGRRGTVVFSQGFGIANPATGEAVTTDNMFRIASVTKPFTSATIFALIEQGRLRLTDTVFGASGVLKTDYGRAPYSPGIEAITIEHLLTHTAGGWGNDYNDPMFSNPRMSQQQLISWILDNRLLDHPPGTNFAYSNFGYCVLGRVIEKVTHQFYPTMVRDLIFHRCGITQMRIANNTAAERAPGEVVYVGQDGENPYGINILRMDSHGGWLASPRELVRFACAIDGPQPLFRADTLATIMTPSAANEHYAKGWAITGRNWWHNGSLPGTSAIMVHTPSGLCWAALANSRRKNPDSVGDLDKMMWDVMRAAKMFS